MKLVKFVGYALVHDDYETPMEAIEDAIENRDNLTAHIFPKSQTEIEWEDDISLNMFNVSQEECEKYFK